MVSVSGRIKRNAQICMTHLINNISWLIGPKHVYGCVECARTSEATFNSISVLFWLFIVHNKFLCVSTYKNRNIHIIKSKRNFSFKNSIVYVKCARWKSQSWQNSLLENNFLINFLVVCIRSDRRHRQFSYFTFSIQSDFFVSYILICCRQTVV